MQFSNEFNRKRYRLGLWFTAPAVLVLLTVLAYPIVASLVLSFLRVRFAGPGLTFQFYGLTNYTELFTNQLFRESLVRSVFFGPKGWPRRPERLSWFTSSAVARRGVPLIGGHCVADK